MASALVTAGRRRLIADGSVFPEGPRWHDGKLWVADQHAHRVFTVDEGGKTETVLQTDDMCSGLGFLPTGELLVTQMRTTQVLRVKAGKTEVHADLSAVAGVVNDMVVDGKGRAYVGCRVGQYAQPVPEGTMERLALVELDGSYRVVADDVVSPNGAVITPDARHLILAESRAKKLSVFDIASDGSLSGHRVWADLTPRTPDGICLDEDGAIWYGSPLTSEFVRVRQGGEVTDIITLEDKAWAIACVLGGPDLKTLYLLCSRTTIENLRKLKDADADRHSDARGRIEAVEVTYAGAGWV